MSWAASEWKEGLPAKALQKIAEYEKQADRLKKEIGQKEFQLGQLNQVSEPTTYMHANLVLYCNICKIFKRSRLSTSTRGH